MNVNVRIGRFFPLLKLNSLVVFDKECIFSSLFVYICIVE